MSDKYVNITGHECDEANQLYTKVVEVTEDGEEIPARTSHSKPTWRSSDGLFEIFVNEATPLRCACKAKLL